jgi:hypothetical protein
VAKPTGLKVMEVNDRFSLRMTYTGEGLVNSNDPVVVSPSKWRVFAQDDEICVQAVSGQMHSIQVYTMSGALVYESATESASYRVRVERGQVYVVQVCMDDESDKKAQKVMVK